MLERGLNPRNKSVVASLGTMEDHNLKTQKREEVQRINPGALNLQKSSRREHNAEGTKNKD